MKRKVRLVFVKQFLEAPTFKDTTTYDCEFTTPVDFDDNALKLIAARTYDDRKTGDGPGGDDNSIIVDYHDLSSLMGKLLTYVEATYVDPEQRKAHKDLVRQTVWDWEKDLRSRAIQTIDSHSGDYAISNPYPDHQ